MTWQIRALSQDSARRLSSREHPLHARFARNALGQEDLQERLIRHVALIRQGFQFLERRCGQTQGDGRC
jgi:hypothetical protein